MMDLRRIRILIQTTSLGGQRMLIGVGLCVKNSILAIERYQLAFGLELGYHVLNDDGTYFHSELCKDGEPMLSVVEAETHINENPVQLGVQFETREALDSAFNILKENGTVIMDRCELPWSPYAAEVMDQFGIRWYLTLQQHRPSEDFSPSDY